MRKIGLYLTVGLVLTIAAFLLWKRSPEISTSAVTQPPVQLAAEKGLSASTSTTSSSTAAKPAPANIESTRTSFYPHRTPPIQLPPGRISEYLPDLIARASGQPPSPEAAYIAYAALNACRGLRGQSKAEAEEIQAKMKFDCSGVSDSQIEQADKLLKLAAELGFARAQIDYARLSPVLLKSGRELARDPQELAQYRADAFRYLQSASRTGNVEAMWFLSEAFSEGVIAEKDDVASLAYKLAIRDTGLGTAPMNNQIPVLERTLTTEQQRRARELASRILASCCERK